MCWGANSITLWTPAWWIWACSLESLFTSYHPSMLLFLSKSLNDVSQFSLHSWCNFWSCNQFIFTAHLSCVWGTDLENALHCHVRGRYLCETMELACLANELYRLCQVRPWTCKCLRDVIITGLEFIDVEQFESTPQKQSITQVITAEKVCCYREAWGIFSRRKI